MTQGDVRGDAQHDKLISDALEYAKERMRKTSENEAERPEPPKSEAQIERKA